MTYIESLNFRARLLAVVLRAVREPKRGKRVVMARFDPEKTKLTDKACRMLIAGAIHPTQRDM